MVGEHLFVWNGARDAHAKLDGVNIGRRLVYFEASDQAQVFDQLKQGLLTPASGPRPLLPVIAMSGHGNSFGLWLSGAMDRHGALDADDGYALRSSGLVGVGVPRERTTPPAPDPRHADRGYRSSARCHASTSGVR